MDTDLEFRAKLRDKELHPLLAVAAVVLVGVVGISVLSTVGGGAGTVPAVSPSRSPSSSRSPAASPVGVGFIERSPVDRLSRIVQGVAFSLSVPVPGWALGPIERLPDASGLRSGSLLVSKSIAGPQGAEAVVFWTSFPDGTDAHPCAQLPGSSVGVSVAELATVVSTAAGTELVTGPSDVTVGGYPAKHVVLAVREDIGCDPGFFYSWHSECWGPCWMETHVGDTIQVWIVEVEGIRIFVEAEMTSNANPELELEIRQIVDSIVFE